MRGRIQAAALGLAVMSVLAAVSSTAGAQTVTQWNVQGNGGFVSLGLSPHRLPSQRCRT